MSKRKYLSVPLALAIIGATPAVASAQEAERPLRQGDTGEEVAELQDLLNDYLAFSNADMDIIREDGIFGRNTRRAVDLWEAQPSSEATVDGEMSAVEVARLIIDVASLESNAAESTVTTGDTGPDVETWQRRLNEWLRLTGSSQYPIIIDGVFGANTTDGTTEFQETVGIQVDDLVQPLDRTRIREEISRLREETHTRGEISPAIEDIQDLLNEYIAYADVDLPLLREDGVFGANTEVAYREFERREGLIEDGAATPVEQVRLAARVGELEANAADNTVEEGDTGAAVQSWQIRLDNWLRLSGNDLHPILTDGVFGSNTTEATKIFQTSAGLQVDGLVEPEDRAALRAALTELRTNGPIGEPGTITAATTLEQLTTASDFTPEHAEVLRLYFAFFDREPDLDGAKYWIGINRDGNDALAIAGAMSGSEEFQNTYAGDDNTQYLTKVYENVLDRQPDDEGFAYWLGFLDRNELNRGEVVRWIAANDEFVTPHGFAGVTPR